MLSTFVVHPLHLQLSQLNLIHAIEAFLGRGGLLVFATVAH
jgi:hypothetical protein